MEKQQKLLSVQEVAKILGVHEETIRRKIQKGHLKSFRLGHTENAHFRIPSEELDRFLVSNSRKEKKS